MAIAFDAASSGQQVGGTTLTIAHTCTGTGVTITAWFKSSKVSNSNDVTATYNGVSMTKSAGQLFAGNVFVTAIFQLYLGTGDASSHNLVFTSATSPDRMGGGIVSMTGTNATQNGAAGNANNTSTSSGVTLTTTADNSWIAGGVLLNAEIGPSGVTPTGTTVTKWSFDDAGGLGSIGGYATTTTAGSNAFSYSNNLTLWGSSAVEIVPAATSAIKTIDGLAKASVKVVDGLAIASVKSWNGLQ